MTNLAHAANIVRGLAADGVQKANSGHPGLPLGCAEIGSVLFFDAMKHAPNRPEWINRDRFVLSAGHGSMLLYSLLHLTGYQVSLEDLKQFRQLNSKTPGHPEFGHTDGVETTTGPLGQGIGNAVGMAIAEKMLAAKYNRPGFPLIDHYTYVLAGDGCMMEGVSAEASSLAGHLQLGKLIVIYDSNNITIEGTTEIAFTESVADRYAAYGWHIQEIDGHDVAQIKKALKEAQADNRPSLIVAKTRIAKGAPTKENSPSAHGAPLGEEEVKGLKKALGLPEEEFYVSDEVRESGQEVVSRGEKLYQQWENLFQAWSREYPELAAEWERDMNNELPTDLENVLPKFAVGEKIATRAASGTVINALADAIPNLVGGSADLAPSTNTYMEKYASVQRDDFSGRNFNFGVREHGMGAILNGICLHGGFRVFGATFLVFSDYMRPAVRLAALMRLPVVYVFTHDSIYVGEDGPTHQPVEQTESLRLIPNLSVFRPADAEEVSAAWLAALKRRNGPTAIVLTRQGLPVVEKPADADIGKGGYVLKPETGGTPDLVIAASGSEVSLALAAAKQLESEGLNVRVASIPNRELFKSQDKSYRDSVVPDNIPVLAVEVGVGTGWYSLVPGAQMRVFSLDEFGVSGPGNQVAEHFGFEASLVAKEAKKLLAQ